MSHTHCNDHSRRKRAKRKHLSMMIKLISQHTVNEMNWMIIFVVRCKLEPFERYKTETCDAQIAKLFLLTSHFLVHTLSLEVYFTNSFFINLDKEREKSNFCRSLGGKLNDLKWTECWLMAEKFVKLISLKTIFFFSQEQSHKSYRPLTVLSFRLNHWFAGGLSSPQSYLAVNLALHCLVSCLFYR